MAVSNKFAVIAVVMVVLAAAVAGSVLFGMYGHDEDDSSMTSTTTIPTSKEDLLSAYPSGIVTTVDSDGETVTGWIYSWTYDDDPYTVTLNFTYEDLIDYRAADVYRGYVSENYTSTETINTNIAFVTYTDPYIIELTSQLIELSGVADTTTDDGQIELAAFILGFAQSFEYVSDSDFYEANKSLLFVDDELVDGVVEEYWKYPLETLYDRAGDCEDTSILLAALFKAAGYDTALVLLPGHAVTAVVLPSDTVGYYYSVDSKNYYFCETTAETSLGQATVTSTATLIIVPDEGEDATLCERALSYYSGQSSVTPTNPFGPRQR
ncbi:MAG: hypothetical protein WCR83_06300 [Candidatus Methanomethylophilaceae archaeon]